MCLASFAVCYYKKEGIGGGLEGQDAENLARSKRRHASYNKMASKVKISTHKRESLWKEGRRSRARWGTFGYAFPVLCYRRGELFEEGTFTYLIYERDSALPSFPRTESCLNWINVNVRGGSFHSK